MSCNELCRLSKGSLLRDGKEKSLSKSGWCYPSPNLSSLPHVPIRSLRTREANTTSGSKPKNTGATFPNHMDGIEFRIQGCFHVLVNPSGPNFLIASANGTSLRAFCYFQRLAGQRSRRSSTERVKALVFPVSHLSSFVQLLQDSSSAHSSVFS